MAIVIRSQKEIERLREAGRLVGRILRRLRAEITPGVTTARLAEITDEMIVEAGAAALFRGVQNAYGKQPFPAAICASVNQELVHGIPGPRMLKEGDILSIDCGVKQDGYCGDAAMTYCVGSVAEDVFRLVRVCEEMLDIAIREIRPGRKWSEIAGLMQAEAEQAGFGVVRDYVGHGIGRRMHEQPQLPNFVSRDLLRRDIVLRKGMILAVEPMITQGDWSVKVLEDGWTVVTTDGKPSAHVEHTLAVTENGVDVLTLP